jgi:hypothetical protein
MEIEKEILDATKEFAKNNNIQYDDIIESMIRNAMREYKLRLSDKNTELLDCCRSYIRSRHLSEDFDKFMNPYIK